MAYFRKEMIEAGIITELNFVRGVEESDKELFFGPLTDKDKFVELTNEVSMSQILPRTGVFPSASEAKRNGWNKPIPKGFSDYFFIGKKTARLTILDMG